MDIVSHIVRFNSYSNGRDKLCRLFQYTSKYACWYAANSGNKDLVDKLKNLENSLSASRKVLRIGKSLDMLDGAVKSLSIEDPLIRSCLVLSKLSQAVYLLVDHYIWASKIGLTSADPKVLSRTASKFWLISLIFNLIRNLYDILTIIDNYKRALRRQAKLQHKGSYSEGESVTVKKASAAGMIQAILSHKPVVTDTIKNSADLLLPMAVIGYVNISTKVQGILGIISSIMGILTIWSPELKLRP